VYIVRILSILSIRVFLFKYIDLACYLSEERQYGDVTRRVIFAKH